MGKYDNYNRSPIHSCILLSLLPPWQRRTILFYSEGPLGVSQRRPIRQGGKHAKSTAVCCLSVRSILTLAPCLCLLRPPPSHMMWLICIKGTEKDVFGGLVAKRQPPWVIHCNDSCISCIIKENTF